MVGDAPADGAPKTGWEGADRFFKKDPGTSD
jgi:hypothetical protein